MKQTDNIRAVCLVIEKKVGNKSAWQKKYWPVWENAAMTIGLDRLIDEIEVRDFHNIEYLIREPEPGKIGLIEWLMMKYRDSEWEEMKADETVNHELMAIWKSALKKKRGNHGRSGPTNEELRIADEGL